VPLIQTTGSGSARSFGLNSFGVPQLPASLTTNLISWYDAAAISTITTSGGKVTNWSNKVSPGTRDLSQATDAYRPVINYSAFSRPSIQFDGTDDYLFHALANQLSTGYTIAVIAKRNNAVDQSGFFPRVLSISPTSRAQTNGNDYDTPNGVIINSTPGANRIGSWANGVDRVINADIDDQFLAVARHSNSLGYGNFLVNNTTVNSTNADTAPVGGPNRTFQVTAMNGGMTIGGNNHSVPTTPSAPTGAGNNENFAGYIAEILIWNYYLSDAELATLGNYVKQKWYLGPLWTTPVVPGYNAGSSYSSQLATLTVGNESVTYSLLSGSLPTGLSLSSTGLISGTVTAGTSGGFTASIRAISSSGYSTTQSLAINQELYTFSSHTFTNAGVTGRQGPSLNTLRSSYSSASWAQDANFLDVTATGIQRWKVPATGTYTITATGAGGGGTGSSYGGYGAVMRDNFNLTVGETINILVGQRGAGGTGANTGSGGTFVVRTPYNQTANVLVAAGGGGGTESGVSDRATANANTSSDGKTGHNEGSSVGGNGAGAGGTGGNGGGAASGDNSGGGGGGFLTNGTRNNNWNNNGGDAFVNGGLGASAGSTGYQGGFGGGGGAGGNGDGGGAGGGGGFSGGGGSDNVGDTAAGGGGSIIQSGLGTNVLNSTAGSFGPGSVVITRVA
jgi:hypothetical protein